MKLFLTGDKQVGKTTVIEKVLSGYTGSVGGFVTQKLFSQQVGQNQIYLFDINDTERKREQQNAVALCGLAQIQKAYPKVFNNAGVKTLTTKPQPSLIVMDELGRIESDAAKFKRAVLRLLHADVHVLGVIQQKDTKFLNEVKMHPAVVLMEVTEQNRNDLPGEILNKLK